MLDLLLSFSITLAILILLVTMHSGRPAEFSVFPSVVLLTTLFRLALNIASTRAILLHGNEGPAAAGEVIRVFGEFVVGGNFAVGIVVFSILVIINFVVITKGATRIAEVAARFTLDAMPGRQMSIDADLNAGIIDERQARERRETIAQEADFYGSMDGASKFVRGDAIAALLIIFINVLGGIRNRRFGSRHVGCGRGQTVYAVDSGRCHHCTNSRAYYVHGSRYHYYAGLYGYEPGQGLN